MLQVERWMDSALERLDAGVDTTLRDLAIEIFAAKDIMSASGESYWDKLKSQFAWTAYCMDTGFVDNRQCTNPIAITAHIEVSEMILGANCADAELESKLREQATGMNKYCNRQDIFPRRHIFPKVNEHGIVEGDETLLLLSHDLWDQYGSAVGAAAQEVNRKLTSQVCSPTSAERVWKLYNGIVCKKRTALGRARLRW